MMKPIKFEPIPDDFDTEAWAKQIVEAISLSLCVPDVYFNPTYSIQTQVDELIVYGLSDDQTKEILILCQEIAVKQVAGNFEITLYLLSLVREWVASGSSFDEIMEKLRLANESGKQV